MYQKRRLLRQKKMSFQNWKNSKSQLFENRIVHQIVCKLLFSSRMKKYQFVCWVFYRKSTTCIRCGRNLSHVIVFFPHPDNCSNIIFLPYMIIFNLFRMFTWHPIWYFILFTNLSTALQFFQLSRFSVIVCKYFLLQLNNVLISRDLIFFFSLLVRG